MYGIKVFNVRNRQWHRVIFSCDTSFRSEHPDRRTVEDAADRLRAGALAGDYPYDSIEVVDVRLQSVTR